MHTATYAEASVSGNVMLGRNRSDWEFPSWPERKVPQQAGS